MKINYAGFKVDHSGIGKFWKLTYPDGHWVLLRDTDDRQFEDYDDFIQYIDMLADRLNPEEDPLDRWIIKDKDR